MAVDSPQCSVVGGCGVSEVGGRGGGRKLGLGGMGLLLIAAVAAILSNDPRKKALRPLFLHNVTAHHPPSALASVFARNWPTHGHKSG